MAETCCEREGKNKGVETEVESSMRQQKNEPEVIN